MQGLSPTERATGSAEDADGRGVMEFDEKLLFMCANDSHPPSNDKNNPIISEVYSTHSALHFGQFTVIPRDIVAMEQGLSIS